MSHELICAWLGLPADAWPPDHYRLLGLEPGEGDVALIEQRVHQRLDSVRRYQMSHPEQATEAMNRLAQAFVCLTEPVAKRAYDQSLPSARARFVPPLPPVPSKPEPRDPLVWLYTPGMNGPGTLPPPPPVRLPVPPLPPQATPVEEAQPLEVVEDEASIPVAPPAPPAPPAEPVDPVLEAARSQQVRAGLATRRSLYRRVSQTRHLMRLWHKMKRHLDDPTKRLSKQESSELAKTVEQVEEAVEDFPLLGEAGQPGYLIVSLATLDRTRDLRNLTESQRESLERDWKAGIKFLEAHRDYLREALKVNRQRTWSERFMRGMRGYLNEQPLCTLLVLLGLLALVVAVWRSWWVGS